MAHEQSIYDFGDYKAYLRSKVGAKSARRGLKTALAKALSCQPTYISHVLNGPAHLSAEQATDLSEFFGHSKDEAHYFLLLLQKDRAGKAALRSYYEDQIKEILDRRLNLSARLGTQNVISEEHKVTFYSSWHYLAIYLALTVPHLQSKSALAAFFQIPLKKVTGILEFLVSAGLATQDGDQFKVASTLLRIGNDSPHILKHHSNWRIKALEALDREDINDLHYSAVVSLSSADVRVIKSRILDNIKDYVATIRQSKEEEVYCLCMDFFNLKSK